MATTSSGSSAMQDSPAPSSVPSTVSTEASVAAPPTSAVEKAPDDKSKLATFLGILRRFVGVADIASVRFSLPAQLLEPTPNLEYWNYLDRPETFVAIGDSDDPLERMLAVLRFWFTKDLKYVKGKPCKPYNSTLGEFFRCNWDVQDTPVAQERPSSRSSNSATTDQKDPIRVSYLTEQTSHHPPVSAFYVDCPAKSITARGFDQLSAKFTGTSIRVTPGAHNLGIFVTLQKRGDEEYQLTHPAAHLGGIIRGSLSVTVADVCFVSCPKSKMKTILHYMEEGWVGKTQNRVEGVVFKYDPENDNKTKIKDVPEADILAKIEGCWRDKLYFSRPKSAEKSLLVDLNPLQPSPKIIPPEVEQLPNESRRFWKDVTAAILAKDFPRATQLKQELEERQREKAAERKEKDEEWQPRFFTGAITPLGKPDLTTDGKDALNGLHKGVYTLSESKIMGA